MEIERLLYSRKNAAFALSISMRSLDYLVANKVINTVRLGKKVMFNIGELKKFASTNHYEAVNTSLRKAEVTA